MAVRFGLPILIALTGVFTNAAWAQTSTVEIVTAPPVEGSAPSVPAKPLDILDTEYPLESLLSNEEGKVQIEVSLDAQGHVTAARVVTSSGHPRLEQQAIQVARARWQFAPGVLGWIGVNVDWKLPLEPVYEYQMLPADIPHGSGRFIFRPASLAPSHNIPVRELPTVSGLTKLTSLSLRIEIQKDGSVGEIKVLHSTGIQRLDTAFMAGVKAHWKYRPAILDDKPIDSLQYANIRPYRTELGAPPIALCTSEPVLDEPLPVAGKFGLRVARRIHIASDGAVDDVILSTRDGWMRLSKSLIAQFASAAKFQPAATANRPDSCWMSVDQTVGGPPAPEPLNSHQLPKDLYPFMAIRSRAQGDVYLRYFVSENGIVTEVEVTKSSGDKLLDETAVKQVKTWLFKPVVENGKPIGMWQTDVFRFRLNF